MTARTTLSTLITELRGMTSAGTADYTINGAAYWTDDQLQNILDAHRTEVVTEPLQWIPDLGAGGTLLVTRYYSQFGNFEQTSGGTAIFHLQDAAWNTVGTANYTANYARGEVVLNSDSRGSLYYLTGRSYDLNSAAADVWKRKAGQVAGAAFSWATDNMRVDKSGLRKEALEMARYYEQQAGPNVITLTRSDTDVD
jgi:hypothetical protein